MIGRIMEVREDGAGGTLFSTDNSDIDNDT